MNNGKKFLATGVTVLAVAVAGTGIALAGSNVEAAPGEVSASSAPVAENDRAEDGRENEAPIAGSALDQASAEALAHLGEGTVTETEVGDEDSYYEVEVTLDDGSETDVQLDRDFNVVGSESEDGSEGNDD